MHSISSYMIRIFDRTIKSKNREDKYVPLGYVKERDSYEIMKTYLTHLKESGFTKEDNSKQMHSINELNCDDEKRLIVGTLTAGKFGIQSNLVNTQTQQIEYVKQTNQADTIDYYFLLYIPKDENKGIALFQGYQTGGIKSIIHDALNLGIEVITGLKLHINPLPYAQVFSEWENASVTEIKVNEISPPTDIADATNKLTNAVTELKGTCSYKISKKGAAFGRFRNFFDTDTNEKKLIEVISGHGSSVKIVANINGKSRTFPVKNDPFSSLNKIILEEYDVVMENGKPTYKSINEFGIDMLNNIIEGLHPN